MNRRPSVITWVAAHPWLLLGLLLGAEACLPPRIQPTAWVLRGAIRVYQLTLSPILPSHCKFTPTCSHYGAEAIRKYGTLRGGALTAWRVIRCNPLSHGGEDPVP